MLTGGVRGWEGEDLSCLGEILHMGSVAVCPDHGDRYLVLFPSTLLILSVSQRMSAFIYEVCFHTKYCLPFKYTENVEYLYLYIPVDCPVSSLWFQKFVLE